ncbi:MAG: UbiX family flavin prenyltransferase [Dehalococcoidia bacterium]|nr:UbiX family flavin prenyltransferase [Dehalococcoidia bacterium]
MPSTPPVVVGISGASGAALAQRLLELLRERGRDAVVVSTAAGAVVWQQEQGCPLKGWLAENGWLSYAIADIAAPIASGTFPTAGMVIVPCSMNTAAAVAHGLSGNLLERAADVTLKEARTLVVVPREAPLSQLHLENLLKLAQLGVRVIPPMPHFYAHPTTVAEVVDHIAGRVLVALGVDGALPPDQQYGTAVWTQ